MSGRRAQSLPPHMLYKPPRSRCLTAICFSWKVLTCIVSHVTLVSLVVAYCIGGALLFQSLEQPHEISVKNGIKNMRRNVTDYIWSMTEETAVLEEDKWTEEVKKRLKKFEEEIHTAMKSNGWDGDENETQSQWTFFGALFYSIIVITTIGYGHISPRTDWGKVTTIFYAIIGIPLMLLCLSTIGDVMATSFRFIYWRVCCFVCTREPKRPRRSRRRSVRHRYTSRSQPPPMRRSMKISVRSADSGFGNYEPGVQHAYSDPEMRTTERDLYGRDRGFSTGGRRGSGGVVGVGGKCGGDNRRQTYDMQRGRHLPGNEYDFRAYDQTTSNKNSRFSNRQRNRDRMRDRHTVERERQLSRSKQHFDSVDDFDVMPQRHKRAQSVRSMRSPNFSRETGRSLAQTLPRGRTSGQQNVQKFRAKSVDPRSYYEDVDEEVVRKTPILCNRYAIDEMDHHRNMSSSVSHYNKGGSPRSQSMPRPHHHKNGYCRNDPPPSATVNHQQRRSSFSRQPPQSRYGNRLELPEFASSHMNHGKHSRSPRYDEFDEDLVECDDDENFQASRGRDRRPRRERLEPLPPSPRIMSPMGFAVNRQPRYRQSFDYDDDSFNEDEWGDYYANISPRDRPVPIWLCVFLVVSYIIAGAFLFHMWEKWTFLDSAYFCFITLTTIGFGDFVPASGVKDKNETSIALCSLYLLFGIALLAMSFNLVQEEFIANVKELGRRLGILKDEEEDD